ncbi:MAG: hypothetical protein WC374_07100 [Phycisphaerae bacterium]|jgi:hypothetical protein
MNPYITPLAGKRFPKISEPVYCALGVAAPVKTKLIITPTAIKANEQGWITACLSLPAGVRRYDIDQDWPLVLYPGQIEACNFKVLQTNGQDNRGAYIIAWFDKSECLESLCSGHNEIEIAGRFKSSRYFFGQSQLIITVGLQRQRRLVPIGLAR